MTQPDDRDDGDPPPALRIRPYTVTRGRTDTDVELTIETMVRAVTGVGPGHGGPAEAEAIVTLCRQPQSIAEISAHLALPLQVVKVLAGDLVNGGSLTTHRAGQGSDGRPDLVLLERVLDGLQNL